MARKLCILGAGGHAKVCFDTAVAAGWTVEAVIAPAGDGDPAVFGDCLFAGDEAAAHQRFDPDIPWLIGLGDLAIRRRLVALAETLGRSLATLIHPSAVVSPSARLGEGVLVGPRAVVNASAEVAANAILNSGCIVEHDAKVGANSHVAPGAVILGGAEVGDDVLIGGGAVILHGVSVGHGAVVAAGAVVARPLDAGARVAGVPAARITSRGAGR